VLALLATGANAAPPAITVIAVLPVEIDPATGDDVVLLEFTAPEFSPDVPYWRNNMDMILRNDEGTDLVLESLSINYSYPDGTFEATGIDASRWKAEFGKDIILPLFRCAGADNVPDGPACDPNGVPPCAGAETCVENGNRILAGSEAHIVIPDVKVRPFPFPRPVPDSVSVVFLFEGFDSHVYVTRRVKLHDRFHSFPGAAKDLPAGHYWFTQHKTYFSHHRFALAQRYAEDWAVTRVDNGKTFRVHPSGDACNAADHLIWGKPIYAVSDGTVVRCANGFPDHPDPCKDEVEPPNTPQTPGGGNHLWIQDAAGETLLYAHFQEGTIPPALCTVDPSVGEHNVSGPSVAAGQFLGLIGNSGRVHFEPHLHIHAENNVALPNQGIPLQYENVRSIGSNFLKLADPDASPWTMGLGARSPLKTVDIGLGALVDPAPRANVAVRSTSAPTPAVAGTSNVSTVVVTNQGPDPATGVQVTYTLPTGFIYLSSGGSCDEVPTGGTLVCPVGFLDETDRTTFEVTSEIPADLVFSAGGPVIATNLLSAQLGVWDASAANNTWTDSITVNAEADLQVVDARVISSPSELVVGAGAEVLVEVKVASDGPSSPLNAVLLPKATSGGAPGTPVAEKLPVPALEDGEMRTVEVAFTLGCAAAGLQMTEFAIEIAPANGADADPDLSNNVEKVMVAVTCDVPVAINVKPESAENPIRVDRGWIPVAILTTAVGEYGLPLAFDATAILAESVRLGAVDVVRNGGGATASRGRGHIEDSYELDETTLDGDPDMVLRFQSSETGLTATSTGVCARGLFSYGTETRSFFGCDSVVAVPSTR
jgi:uncharacterized repeat protein (TIGR01451 family)